MSKRPRRNHSPAFKAKHAKIGELTLENNFLEGALSKAGLLNARR
jgi:transposase